MGARESVIHRAILSTLREYGGTWIKIHGNATQGGGISDIIGCISGRFVAFEVKRHDGTHGLSPKQELFLDRITADGGISAVITSPEEAIVTLAKHGL
tara:strand:- start:134 stop:427 length:294 start_codon:yes stop_codon:yes gene_type:complete